MSANGDGRKGFLAQMFQYFKRPDQTTADFKAELDALTEQDKLDFWRMFNDAGLVCDPPSQTSAPAAA